MFIKRKSDKGGKGAKDLGNGKNSSERLDLLKLIDEGEENGTNFKDIDIKDEFFKGDGIKGRKPLLSLPVEGEKRESVSGNLGWLESLTDKFLRWFENLTSVKVDPEEQRLEDALEEEVIQAPEAGWLKGTRLSPVRKLLTVNREDRGEEKGKKRSVTLTRRTFSKIGRLRKGFDERHGVSAPVRERQEPSVVQKQEAKPELRDRGEGSTNRKEEHRNGVGTAVKEQSDVKNKGKKSKETRQKQKLGTNYKPFENCLSLVTFIEYDMRNRQVGAYLLKHNQEYRFVFAFECAGIHPTLSDAELKGIFSRIEAGMKDLPAGEYLTFYYRSFRTGDDRFQYLKKLLLMANKPILQLILAYEFARTKELVNKGIRKPKQLYLYVTYTITSEAEQSHSWYEKFLAQVFQSYELITGDKQIREQKFENFVKQGFLDGYLKWENFLVSTLGLSVRPIRSPELWQLLWHRLNKGEVSVGLPQFIYVGDSQVREIIHSQVHPSSLLLAEQEPIADERWVKVKDSYVAALNLLDKPGGWENCRAQLRYLWDIISRERVYDIEIFSEIGRANESLVKESMQRLMKQSLTSQSLANQSSSIDVVAGLKAEAAVDAQAEIYSGAVPLWLGFTILVYRQSLDLLDEACRYLESCFLRPAWVQRERFLTWRIWLQTLPVTWEGILTKPYMRRLLFLHGEVLGLIPWIMPVTVDRAGLELITDEGGAPVWINLTASAEPKHLGIFATTRAGKSVLVSGILSSALVTGMPIVVVDFPKPDGTSTFTDYTRNLEGAYFDISKESNNLFQIPDLSHHSLEDIPNFFADYVGFLEGALMTMVLGKGDGVEPILKNNIRAILTLALNDFFHDEEILRRYDDALTAGQGTEAWNQTPTLRDFIGFCNFDKMRYKAKATTGLKEAFEVVNLRLQQWLVSRVGRSIATPTSFNVNSQLIVFALRNIQNEEDAAVLALSALGSAMRCALSSPASIFFIDEAPILFEFPSISDLIGRLCANGAKAGIRVILSAQDPKTVVEASSGSKICDNLAVRLVGRIQPTAVASFQKYLQYPQEIVSRNATKAFFPNKNEIYSQWLLDYQGSYTYCRYYPGMLQLSLVANNPDEQELRNKIFAKEPDRMKAMVKMTEALEQKLRG